MSIEDKYDAGGEIDDQGRIDFLIVEPLSSGNLKERLCKKYMKKWIYDRNGQAVALDCGDSVYDPNGNFALWKHGHNLYNQNGNHVGWTEGGVFYDSNNDVIGFTRDHTQNLPSNPGYGGNSGITGVEWKPGRPGFEGEPGRPGYGGWSGTDLEDYIEEC